MAILKAILTVLFVIASLAVIAIVLMQEGKSAGLGSISGSSGGDTYWDKNKKHSLEGKFERWTKLTAGLFVFIALVLMIMPASSSNNVSNTTIEAPADAASQDATVEGTDGTGAEEGAAATEVPAEGEAAADAAVEANDAASTEATTEAPAESATTEAN